MLVSHIDCQQGPQVKSVAVHNEQEDKTNNLVCKLTNNPMHVYSQISTTK